MKKLSQKWTYHQNPDGSIGGVIYEGATVAPTAYIGRTAAVLPGAVIKPFETVRNGSVITPEGIELRVEGPDVHYS